VGEVHKSDSSTSGTRTGMYWLVLQVFQRTFSSTISLTGSANRSANVFANRACLVSEKLSRDVRDSLSLSLSLSAPVYLVRKI